MMPNVVSCRREGTKHLLKGDRCSPTSAPLTAAPTRPVSMAAPVKKLSDYAVQLREKQKVRRVYGVLEKQSTVTSSTPIWRRA